ncbi:helix-turn-helix domain-containing protein [Parapedobacter sp.]
MVREFIEQATRGRFVMYRDDALFIGGGMHRPEVEPINTFVYNKGGEQRVTIDEITYTMPSASILPLVYSQHFVFERPEALIAWQFNRAFYCIVDHDAEVGCVGFLFYGIYHPMFIRLDAEDVSDLDHLEKVISEEMTVHDNFQGEMLRTLLKRIIIKVTRKAKKQCESYQLFPDEKMDLVRRFALLVEINFKQEHEVGFYAEALHKSPKTLANVFALLKQPRPSAIIRNRIVIEAKRYLHYSDKSAKEIAYELGFESPSHFNRFFKQHTGKPPWAFKESDGRNI